MADATITTSTLVGGVQLGGGDDGDGDTVAPLPESRTRTATMAQGATRNMASISVIIAEQHDVDDLPKMEADAKEWIGTVLDEELPDGPLQPLLKDGILLCRLINKIFPGACQKPSESKTKFKQMDNISTYLRATAHYGVPAHDSFQTVTLYDNQYFPAVLNNLFSLSRTAAAKGFAGPSLGPKLSVKTPREFSNQQLAEAVAQPRIFGGLGSELTMSASALPQQLPSQNTQNMVLQGLTLEAKVTALQQSLGDVTRRLDRMELKAEMAANQGCSCKCEIM